MNNAESFLKRKRIFSGNLGNSPKLKYKPNHWNGTVYWVADYRTRTAFVFCNHYMIDVAHINFVKDLYSQRVVEIDKNSQQYAEVLDNINRIRRIYADQEKRDKERAEWIDKQNRYAAAALEKVIEQSKRSRVGDCADSTRDSKKRGDGRLFGESVVQLRILRRRRSGSSGFSRRVKACST